MQIIQASNRQTSLIMRIKEGIVQRDLPSAATGIGAVFRSFDFRFCGFPAGGKLSCNRPGNHVA
ncbi:hypothetical protein CRP01_18475 [Flavilitoribacter nigricans DSM 23189 = NBRC 102662]|uniref:Uncharacterized protein n=1 Tax=Flavilitoribacter nigricans (strain ATCC 23147 / DSM 23189 / NBRC 102662 / NCIMB 1420 / SS-2) TaxID=1122177 RepID=A0A2D0N927_FLAN2|nr:hypothetical protein CRP01_18475 [Flavilitoribacter nigricans DSM 23189 = NBRC 102662]